MCFCNFLSKTTPSFRSCAALCSLGPFPSISAAKKRHGYGSVNRHFRWYSYIWNACYLLTYQRDGAGVCSECKHPFRFGTRLAFSPAYPRQGVQRNSDHEPQGESRNEEEPEGFLTHRVADRRGDHFDHRGHRNSEPASRTYRGERSGGSGSAAHDVSP